MVNRSFRLLFLIPLILAGACREPGKTEKGREATAATPPVITTTTVISREISRQLRLPGELGPYQDVTLAPKVEGIIESVSVDRGSTVRAGQILARLRAPELGLRRREGEAVSAAAKARHAEAEARLRAIRSDCLAVESRLAASAATLRRLESAAATPGVVSGNELENARHQTRAEESRRDACRENEIAATAQARALADNETAAGEAAAAARATEDYLILRAPFDGIVTERRAHPGSLSGPTQPILRLQQVSRLRLVIYLPEAEIASVQKAGIGAQIPFTVSSFPGETFTGRLARPAGAIDPTTRTMPVEIDVLNPDRRLAPGMFGQILWRSARPTPSLLVPQSAVVTTTERTFVIRIENGVARWIDVKRGIVGGIEAKDAGGKDIGKDLLEVFGNLSAEDRLVLRGSDELRDGTRVVANTP